MTVRVKLNSAAVRNLLHDGRIESDIRRRAEAVAAQASSGLEDPSGMTVIDAGDSRRARSIVLTTTFEARMAEAHGRALTQAIDAAR